MHVEPDAQEAVADRTRLLERMHGVLDRAELMPFSRDVLRHPAAVEIVHAAQRALRSGQLAPHQRRALADRLDRVPRPAFGPAAPQDHLLRSVARALRSIPPQEGMDGQPVTAEVAAWREPEREVLAEALDLLTRAWPESAAEVGQTVVEIALLAGDAIDGFTDFTVHGAVLINRRRLAASSAGLPGPVRLAEALVHEGAHTRCNAAAAAEPFLLADRPAASGVSGGSAEVLVATPLRADPRPLTGLFQQAVVLARSVLLYRRLVGLTSAVGAPAVGARYESLVNSAHQAVDTLSGHARMLTERGHQVLTECAIAVGSTA
ncbi:aKG-HExxH-type peptide beta-hydroxylase [Kitasatospora aureofaciens]|uniref:aKG-HExxH-type peptide beta-hydroxylase n=1 Tax=Kitasatospora aureofaciens TaxID=1894 RepID=UPI001C47A8AC|nr:HEXXH motif-containing putative peptide modification protein [Kitasatospora aureofaciens]MBV6699961.1 hypothetical protein [Kitasatospora aureofaciens]